MKILKNIAIIESPWIKIYCESLKDEKENLLDYWRVEKANSLVVIPIVNAKWFALPHPCYRHGIGESTYDFPGGRIPDQCNLQIESEKILERELGIENSKIQEIVELNSSGWAINSSFSNQLLFCTVANMVIGENDKRHNELKVEWIPVSNAGVSEVRNKLKCLQCRAALLEWYFSNRSSIPQR